MGLTLITGYASPVEITVGRLVDHLPRTLGAMYVDARCIAAIAEFGDGRYVQFWADVGDALVSEVVSNHRLGGPRVLSRLDEQRLRDLGWSEPGATEGPNWRHESWGVGGLIVSVAMVRSVIVDVLNEDRDNVVALRSWVVRRDRSVGAAVARDESRTRFRESLDDVRRQLESD